MSKVGKRVARLGDRSFPSRSPSVTASANVLVNRRPVLRVGDEGASGWVAAEGAPCILVNDRQIHRIHDAHSASEAFDGSFDVLAGMFQDVLAGVPEELPLGLEVTLECEHKTPKPRTAIPWFQTLDVVSKCERISPGHEEPVDEVTVHVKSNGLPLPKTLQVHREGAFVEDVTLKGSTCTFKTSCLSEHAVFWSSRFWDGGTKYSISCAGAMISVRARPAHNWSVALEFPSIWKKETGTQVTTGATTMAQGQKPHLFKKKVKVQAAEISTWKPWEGLAIDSTLRAKVARAKWTERKPISLEGPAEPELGDMGHEFLVIYRDGEDFASVTSKLPERLQQIYARFRTVTDALLTGAELHLRLMAWLKEIKKCVPEVGFFWNLSLEVLQGKAEFFAEWKELERYESYLAMGIKVEVTLFSIDFTVNFGAKWSNFEGSVFIGAEGEVSVDFSGQRDSPDQPAQLSVNTTTLIEAKVGAILRAGDYAELEATAKTGFELETQFVFGAAAAGKRWGGKLSWTGVKAQAKVSTWLGFTRTFNADVAKYVPALAGTPIHKWGSCS